MSQPKHLRDTQRGRAASYVGREITHQPGRHLSMDDILRLMEIERRNRRRARDLGGAHARVDFVAQLFHQNWLCIICQRPLSPYLRGPDPLSISLEHDPALSVGLRHDSETVRGAHLQCNITKAHTTDTPRAAKIKRVQKDEAEHAERMVLKAKGKALPRGAIQSRGWAKKPKGYIHQWPKRPLRSKGAKP